MTSIRFPLLHLQAAALFAAKKDIRYYLQGVLCERRAGVVRLVGTDGSILAVLTSDLDKGNDVPDAAYIIPLDDVTRLIKAMPKSLWSIDLTPTKDDAGYISSPSLHALGSPVLFKPVDGTFPDWRRVIPRGETVPCAAQFNTDLLAPFTKAARLLGSKVSNPYVHHAGEGGALVTLPTEDFVGVVMPLRERSMSDARDTRAAAVRMALGE